MRLSLGRGPVLAGVLALAVVLTGCSSDPLASKYGGNDGTSSSDGSFTEFAPADRGEPVVFEGTTDTGTTVSNEDYAGEVLVVNFWYAICAPCRAEAPELQELYSKYQDSGVSFLGVNTEDQSETALAFARKFGITYPSVMDSNDAMVRLAFAGKAAPTATPTTLLLDRQGRVAARFLGQITQSNLDTVIRELVAEGS